MRFETVDSRFSSTNQGFQSFQFVLKLMPPEFAMHRAHRVRMIHCSEGQYGEGHAAAQRQCELEPELPNAVDRPPINHTKNNRKYETAEGKSHDGCAT